MNKGTAIFYFFMSLQCSLSAIYNQAFLVGSVGFMVVLFRCKEIDDLENALEYVRTEVSLRDTLIRQLNAELSA